MYPPYTRNSAEAKTLHSACLTVKQDPLHKHVQQQIYNDHGSLSAWRLTVLIYMINCFFFLHDSPKSMRAIDEKQRKKKKRPGLRVWHKTLCGRAEKTNNTPEINTASFYSMVNDAINNLSGRHSSVEGVWVRHFSGRKGLSILAGLPRLHMTKVPWTSNWVRSSDHSKAKRNLDTLLFQRGYRIVERNTKQKTCQKRMCYPASGYSSSKLTKVVCSLTSGICHHTERFLIQLIFRKENAVPLRVMSCDLLQSSPSKDVNNRPYRPHPSVSFPSLFSSSESCTSLQVLVHWNAASLGALKMLLNHILPR